MKGKNILVGVGEKGINETQVSLCSCESVKIEGRQGKTIFSL